MGWQFKRWCCDRGRGVDWFRCGSGGDRMVEREKRERETRVVRTCQYIKRVCCYYADQEGVSIH